MVRKEVLALLMVFAMLGCEPAADVENPKTFDNTGMTFSYPGNWTVTDETGELVEGIQIDTATIETPGDGIVVITTIDPPESFGLDLFANTTEELRVEELKNALGKADGLFRISKTKKSAIKPAFESALPDAIRHDFSIEVFGESVPHWGDFYMFRGATHDVITYSQVAHEDWAKVEPGFNLIHKTMVAK